jgi:succinyl-diaminopimelate desuccinylase
VQLDLRAGPGALALDLVNLPSVSGSEGPLADALEAALRACPHLEVRRDGDALVAATNVGAPARVVVAGHLDTVPVAGNLPGRLQPGPDGAPELWGRGAVDMKGGLAAMAATAAAAVAPKTDVTWVFYDQEEVAADLSGLGRLIRLHPDWLRGDFAVLCEPTAAGLEGGCNGTLRVKVEAHGVAAHSARPWAGRNAIHGAAPILDRLVAYQPAQVEVDGLIYPEAMNAVGIVGGVAGNVIPDRCEVVVNYRFAPAKTVAQALAHVTDLFQGFEVILDDAAGGARPGLDQPLAARFAALVAAYGGGEPRPKVGWTDVARFAALGVPAVNCGPGDPSLAHAADERCPVEQIERVARILGALLER